MKEEKISIPLACAIIERVRDGKTEILIQTRWKPKYDPVYSGTIELAVGKVDAYENIYETLKREVLEETGLKVITIKSDLKTKSHSVQDDEAFAFVPFCAFQQTKGGKPWIGFAFICEVEDEEPKPQTSEVKDIRWIDKDELQQIFLQNPEKIFTLQLGLLDYYFSHT